MTGYIRIDGNVYADPTVRHEIYFNLYRKNIKVTDIQIQKMGMINPITFVLMEIEGEDVEPIEYVVSFVMHGDIPVEMEMIDRREAIKKRTKTTMTNHKQVKEDNQ